MDGRNAWIPLPLLSGERLPAAWVDLDAFDRTPTHRGHGRCSP